MFSLIDMLGNDAPVINIVDVGALWLGELELGYRPLLMPGRAGVIGFEPVKEECDKLNAMGMEGHRYLPYFIGDGTEREFCRNNSVMTSSLYEPNRALVDRFNYLGELMQPVHREKVRTTRLDDVPEIERIDYLKLDIQGAELDALRGAVRCLGQAVVVETEVEFVPLYRDQPLFAEVDQEMRRRGFLLHALPAISGRVFKPLAFTGEPAKRLSQVLWTDAVYVRDFTRLADLDPDSLLRMAVIVHSLYDSVDLAGLCLLHYDAKMKSSLWGRYMQGLLGTAQPPSPPPLP